MSSVEAVAAGYLDGIIDGAAPMQEEERGTCDELLSCLVRMGGADGGGGDDGGGGRG